MAAMADTADLADLADMVDRADMADLVDWADMADMAESRNTAAPRLNQVLLQAHSEDRMYTPYNQRQLGIWCLFSLSSLRNKI